MFGIKRGRLVCIDVTRSSRSSGESQLQKFEMVVWVSMSRINLDYNQANTIHY